ncbi:MAG: tRNA pseudouridine(55) synthase TruB, partial [Marmoricola sp.]
IRLGESTSTDDAEGETTATADASALTDKQVRSALAAFVGDLDQVPSSVSAIKVDGKRAYTRVREGEQVELKPRRITIHGVDVLDTRPGGVFDVDLAVRCSSGTYVRAIARDLGAALGVGGHLTALRRTAVGPFTLDAARTLDQLADELTVLPIGAVARTCFPSYDLGAEQATDVGFGRKLTLTLTAEGPVALFAPDGAFLALYQQDGERARAVAVFPD